MLPRLHRLSASLLPPLVGLLVYAAASASAASDPIGQTKAILDELQAKRVAASTSATSATSAAPVGASKTDAGVGADSSSPSAAAPAASPVVAADGAIAKAKKMLDRAVQLRALGDGARAELAEDTALEWAETARDLVAAVEDERIANEQGQSAVALTTKAERTRQLLEEAIARRGRLQGVLDGLEAQQLDAAQKSLEDRGVGGAPKKSAGAK